jgi:branched-chain amino acid transport system permease protein
LLAASDDARTTIRRALRPLVPAAAIVAVQLVAFPVPIGIWLRGLIVGGLTALIALGMALTYRSNRIINFAHADLGTTPVVLLFLLHTVWGWNLAVATGAGILGAIVLGAVVELAVIRRFFDSPRLLLTVATLGLTQLLAAAAILLPKAFGQPRLLAPRLDPPFHARVEIDGVIFNGNDVQAMIVVPVAVIALGLFLKSSAVGVAIRASADSADRASLLGVPVKRLQTVVWVVASLLAFTAIYLRAGLVGLPVTSALSFGVLLRALAALLIGRLTNLVTIFTSALALGVLELGIFRNAESPLLIDPILGVVIAVALLVRRRSSGRTDIADASSWRSSDEVRPVPPSLARLPEVRLLRICGPALILAFAVVLPHLLDVEKSLKASALLIYALLGLSVVVLTGWSGQVSLGQIGFFALGAAVGAKATVDWDLDLLLAFAVAGVVGALAAVVVGLPALRVRGLYLAVTTFAFSLAITSYFLNRRFAVADWLTDRGERIERPPLLGQVDIDSPTRIYYLSLAVLVVALVCLRGIRQSRTGRALLALRDNERAAQAYAIDAGRTRLLGFALAGAIASVAGCLFVHHQQAIGVQPFNPGENFALFTMVVVGGVATPAGAVLGALFLQSIRWFLPTDWQLLASGGGVLLILLVAPGGVGGLALRLRDLWLRGVAQRHQLDAPGIKSGRLDLEGDDAARTAAAAAASATVEPLPVGR